MTAPIVQAEYDQLSLLAGWFRQQADQTQTLHNNFRRTYAVLYDGGWQGRGSTAFFNEMTSEVYPALVRLYGALEAGDAVLREISAILQAAEEEAAAPFRGNSASAGAGAGTTVAAGAPSVTAGGNPANIPTSTPEIPVGQVFSHGSMDRLIDSTFKGADSPALNNAMETLLDPLASQTAKDQALAVIADSRGMSLAEVTTQYAEFQRLNAVAQARIQANGAEAIPELDQSRHADFAGSTSNLRYGKMVGDVLGIDPVFGALLNPTGGIVGPGNIGLDLGNTSVGYHGVVHDAAGYLYNYHQMGPGYNYLHAEPFDRGNPLAGQASGISYWEVKLPAHRVAHAVGDSIRTAQGGINETVKWANDVSDTVQRGWQETREWFGDLF